MPSHTLPSHCTPLHTHTHPYTPSHTLTPPSPHTLTPPSHRLTPPCTTVGARARLRARGRQPPRGGAQPPRGRARGRGAHATAWPRLDARARDDVRRETCGISSLQPDAAQCCHPCASTLQPHATPCNLLGGAALRNAFSLRLASRLSVVVPQGVGPGMQFQVMG